MSDIDTRVRFVKNEDGSLELVGKSMFIGDDVALLDSIAELVADSQPHLIMTINVDQVLLVQRQKSLADAFMGASIRTLDGVPLVWLAKALGVVNVQRNTGADLIYQVCERSADTAWRVGIAGGRSGVARLAADNLRARYKGVQVFGIDFPKIDNASDEISSDFIETLRKLEIDVLFLCLGCPKQEIWFQHWKSELPGGVYVGAGAAVDFAAGTAKRAPRVLQDFGLEWFWRLCHDPRRLARRYLVRGPQFFGVILKSVAMLIRREQ